MLYLLGSVSKYYNKDKLLFQLPSQLFYHYRLHIMSILVIEKEISFVTLRNQLNISDRSLDSHLKYLKKMQVLYL